MSGGMNDEDRKALTWSIRHVERGARDQMGALVPKGWWVVGFEDDIDEAVASINISHLGGPYAAASLAAVISHMLNTFERDRPASKEED